MIPDALPTLSYGSHAPNAGQACVMEYVSILAGEEWTDHPTCTHPTLAAAAIHVNDILGDCDRALLVPLICRLIGTTEGYRYDRVPNGWAIAMDDAHPVNRALHGITADCVGPSDPARVAWVAWLSGLIDLYDEASGRNDVPEVTEEQFKAAALVVAGS